MILNFDFDGVIVDSLDHLTMLAVQAWKQVGSGRMPTTDDFRNSDNLTLRNIGRAIGLTDNQAMQFVQRVYGLQNNARHLTVFSGVKSVLQKLSEHHTLTIISSNRTKSVVESVHACGLATFISIILGGDMGLTKAERIKQVLDQTRQTPDEAFMIGDAVSDLHQGRQAGVRTIAVTWGFQSRERLELEKPDFVVDRPEQLLEILAPEAGQGKGLEKTDS